KLLTDVIPALLDNTATYAPQDESQATFTKKFVTDNGFIECSELDAALAGASDKAEVILRTINALTPEPGCWTLKDGKRIKLLAAKMDGGVLRLTRIQHDGQRPVEALSISAL